MTPLDYDPAYSAGVRNLLIETATPRTSKRRHRIWIGLSLVAGLSLLGAGGAVAANYLLPGADIVTDTSTSHTVTGIGPSEINIGAAPAGTNSFETSLACLSAGTLTWPDGASRPAPLLTPHIRASTALLGHPTKDVSTSARPRVHAGGSPTRSATASRQAWRPTRPDRPTASTATMGTLTSSRHRQQRTRRLCLRQAARNRRWLQQREDPRRQRQMHGGRSGEDRHRPCLRVRRQDADRRLPNRRLSKSQMPAPGTTVFEGSVPEPILRAEQLSSPLRDALLTARSASNVRL